MKIFVTAKSKAKEERIERIDDDHFVVAVKAPPAKGQANQAIIKKLAEYFDVPSIDVRIISGFRTRRKIVEIQKNN